MTRTRRWEELEELEEEEEWKDGGRMRGRPVERPFPHPPNLQCECNALPIGQ